MREKKYRKTDGKKERKIKALGENGDDEDVKSTNDAMRN